ncbi:MAG: hypothetical protein LBE15_06465 [Burkholderiales bacterium]|jgi:hypothetical protein|nr:hypothetical protein [Burkholderiales bacterium]
MKNFLARFWFKYIQYERNDTVFFRVPAFAGASGKNATLATPSSVEHRPCGSDDLERFLEAEVRLNNKRLGLNQNRSNGFAAFFAATELPRSVDTTTGIAGGLISKRNASARRAPARWAMMKWGWLFG